MVLDNDIFDFEYYDSMDAYIELVAKFGENLLDKFYNNLYSSSYVPFHQLYFLVF